ncbi:MAG: sodium:alanine symporter family protein [Kiritimatiellae bacterium]|nr:sodium:alanine symporter family protein [Kiritimatiellia bacterium]
MNWLDAFTEYVNIVDDYVWGMPLICLILFGGIWLTISLRGMQFVQLPRALRYMLKNEETGKGEVTSFAALCTALSATIGTGNIVGVATAYVTGGPGAIFWMWTAALFGMATKYSEGLLAVKYRDHDPETGRTLGGPFYYIERGMGPRWKWLAKLFSVFGVMVGLFGIGTFTQVNSICGSFNTFFQTWIDPAKTHVFTIFGNQYSCGVIFGSILLAFMVGMVVIGGLKRIAAVSEKVIPLMVVLYAVFVLLLLGCNITAIPAAVAAIVKGAFAPSAVTGGIVGSFIVAMQKGIARGIFSNEAGLGSAPIAAAAAQTHEPVRQGLVSMTGTFLDTIVVCSMTGLALTLTGQKFGPDALQGAAATMQAFREGIPFLPWIVTDFFLMASLILFGFTTILGWDYYSERCLEYLTGGNMKPVMIYRWLYIAAVFVGPYMTISAVWGIADIVNGLMAIPNMIALIVLSGVIAKETKSYFDRLKRGEITE